MHLFQYLKVAFSLYYKVEQSCLPLFGDEARSCTKGSKIAFAVKTCG